MTDRVAFQGIRGAYSEIAIYEHFGEEVETLPCADLFELFEAIQQGRANYGILPVENSVAGAVDQAYEMLIDYDFRIQAEKILRIHHALMVVPGLKFEDIESVQSHPQALAQCERFLHRYKIKPVRWHDTAGSAYDLARDQTPNTGAIASEFAGELYGLEILQKEIEDSPFNFTRFFVLGNEDAPKGDYNKTSIVFATRHNPGALYDCLGAFAKRNLNLTRIESRPRRNRPWEPVFYLDFEGHWQDDHCKEAVTALLQKASFVKLLGSYPAEKTEATGRI